MIAGLRGQVAEVALESAVIDVGGVGYLVSASRRTLTGLTVGDSVSLKIETHVREDRIQLFGFSSTLERNWFRRLLSVQGVGTRGALAILSVLPADGLALVIASQDRTALIRADGIGPKLAGRILNELKDKVADLAAAAATTPAEESPTRPAGKRDAGGGEGGDAERPSATTVEEAVSALVNLGYGRAEAYRVVTTQARQLAEGEGIEPLIRAALQALSQPDVPPDRGSRHHG